MNKIQFYVFYRILIISNISYKHYIIIYKPKNYIYINSNHFRICPTLKFIQMSSLANICSLLQMLTYFPVCYFNENYILTIFISFELKGDSVL